MKWMNKIAAGTLLISFLAGATLPAVALADTIKEDLGSGDRSTAEYAKHCQNVKEYKRIFDEVKPAKDKAADQMVADGKVKDASEVHPTPNTADYLSIMKPWGQAYQSIMQNRGSVPEADVKTYFKEIPQSAYVGAWARMQAESNWWDKVTTVFQGQDLSKWEESFNANAVAGCAEKYPDYMSDTTRTKMGAGRYNAQGLFTNPNITVIDCNSSAAELDAVKKKMATSGELDKSGTDITLQTDKANSRDSDMISKNGAKAAKNMAVTVQDSFFGPGCGAFSAVAYMTNMTNPVSITNNKLVMNWVGFTQLLAMGGSVILIVFFGLMYSMGFHKLNPMTFFLRYAAAMIAVYFLPYIMQDILNINNKFVVDISRLDITGNAVGAVTASAGLATGAGIAAVVEVLAGFAAGGFLWAVFVFAFLLMLLKPIIKLVMWWYMRLLMIFVLAILGPLFIIMIALPQTSKMATKWLNMFIGHTFQQTFLALGLMLFADILMNLSTINAATGITWFGDIILLYAMLNFLADMPEMANDFLGGGRVPGAAAAKDLATAAAAFATSATNYGAKKRTEAGDKAKFEGNVGAMAAKNAGAAFKALEAGAEATIGEKVSQSALGTAMMLDGSIGGSTQRLSNLNGDQKSKIALNQQAGLSADRQKAEIQGMALDNRMSAAMDKSISENDFAENAQNALISGRAIDPDWENSANESERSEYQTWKGGLDRMASEDANQIVQDIEKSQGYSLNASEQIANAVNSGIATEGNVGEILKADAFFNQRMVQTGIDTDRFGNQIPVFEKVPVEQVDARASQFQRESGQTAEVRRLDSREQDSHAKEILNTHNGGLKRELGLEREDLRKSAKITETTNVGGKGGVSARKGFHPGEGVEKADINFGAVNKNVEFDAKETNGSSRSSNSGQGNRGD